MPLSPTKRDIPVPSNSSRHFCLTEKNKRVADHLSTYRTFFFMIWRHLLLPGQLDTHDKHTISYFDPPKNTRSPLPVDTPGSIPPVVSRNECISSPPTKNTTKVKTSSLDWRASLRTLVNPKLSAMQGGEHSITTEAVHPKPGVHVKTMQFDSSVNQRARRITCYSDRAITLPT